MASAELPSPELAARFELVDSKREDSKREGASGVVYRARSRSSQALVAIKVAKSSGSSTTSSSTTSSSTTSTTSTTNEGALLARLQRRYGPTLVDVGRLDDGSVWMATTWVEGDALSPSSSSSRIGKTGKTGTIDKTAAIVALGVARGLDELHRAGVRHGDVKPANIILSQSSSSALATLIDLDLATDVASNVIAGATPRYLAPEILAGEAPTPAADLYALGLVLAEILHPDALPADKPIDRAVLLRVLSKHERVEDTWIESLLAPSPGARPSAAWVAARAAQLLELTPDPQDVIRDRHARILRTYLAARRSALSGAVDPRIDGVARVWLDEALALLAKLHDAASSSSSVGASPGSLASIVQPLDALETSRWIVSLVGPIATTWSRINVPEGDLAKRLLTLAETLPPEAWTIDDVLGSSTPRASVRTATTLAAAPDWLSLTRSLAMPRPDAATLEAAEQALMNAREGEREESLRTTRAPSAQMKDKRESERAPRGFSRDLASALLRCGDVGRAFAAISHDDFEDDDDGDPIILLRAEIARRRGDRDSATRFARRLVASFTDPNTRSGAMALLARLAWDQSDFDRAETELAEAEQHNSAVLEVRALIAYARGDYERGLSILDTAASSRTNDEGYGLALARIEGTRGMLEHARGRARASHEAFSRAVDFAMRAGAVIEEATYLTGLAAAAVDAGATASAIASATRGALLWERLGRGALAARAHLSRAAAFALIGASHEADLAAEEATRAAEASRDARAAAYARWAIVETRAPGDAIARKEAIDAATALSSLPGSEEDRVRAAARVIVWASNEGMSSALRLDPKATDERVHSLSAAARWEWWGARASISSAASAIAQRVLAEIIALLDVPAPLGSRGPTLAAGARLARDLGDGEALNRMDALRRTLASALREGAPAEHRAALSSVEWLEGIADDDARTALPAAQVGQLEAIVRALSSRDRLKPLLAQVVDTMVLWTGVERGLLLLRAPDGKLVPRAARNLARQDLAGEQLALSTSLARRAMSEREAICATDAFAQVGDLHASVHALGLRSVLAVPLIARGDVLGVVYLDDRVRRGAFGPGELAWVRLVASQAALAIADARDQTLLRRAVRKAERANARLAADLGAREAELANVRAELVATSNVETRFRYDEISGRSEPMRAMLRLVDRVTASDVPVLLAGESGTGKELVARAIHGNGPRGQQGRAFVSENCGSVPETLLESTLFGHVRGAFTGASATRAGLFDVADGGTLLLDEIGEMPLSMQTKLLRVLQNGEVRPVGGEKSRIVNVRIIGATHRDLEAMVAAGTFREDLFYRLNVVSIRVPPLRERREDIPLLVNRFVEKYARDSSNTATTTPASEPRKVKVTRAAMDRLTTFPWPGNVRQLENEIRRALVLADDRIDVGELSEEVSRGGPSAARDAGLGLKARVDALEAQLVKDALQKTNNNQTRAAEVLGISRFGLQKMMRRLGVKTGGAS